MNILGVDIGGTHVKFRTQRHKDEVKVKSGRKFTPAKMMEALEEYAGAWSYDHVTLGYPGPVVHDKPLAEPHNLAPGWVHFDYKRAFGNRPLRIMNDAAMQALGSYRSGRMLFLGLGTGLGSAMVVEGVVHSMEIAHMPWKKGKTYEDFLGEAGLKRDGRKTWTKHVYEVVEQLQQALESEYVVLGGGNAKLVKKLPKNVILGANTNAFEGAFRIWKTPQKSWR